MDKTIMLRSHHFGEIYEIFVGWLSTKSSEKYIDSLIKRKIDFFCFKHKLSPGNNK